MNIKNKYKIDNNAELTVIMLMSKKVKTWNLNLYPCFIKVIDNHYTISGIAGKTQQSLDQGIKSENTTLHDTTYDTNRPQRLSRRNVPIKQKQPLRTNRQPLRPQQTSSTTPHKGDHC